MPTVALAAAALGVLCMSLAPDPYVAWSGLPEKGLHREYVDNPHYRSTWWYRRSFDHSSYAVGASVIQRAKYVIFGASDSKNHTSNDFSGIIFSKLKYSVLLPSG